MAAGEGKRAGGLQPRRAAVALALGEKELFVEALEASMEAARQSGSRYASAMVKQLLMRGQERWPQERQLSEWAVSIDISA
ncbi:hypothetical protein A4R35_03700 [Thermogemmatispora tikiterensis]|uniref:Uncharacterized protein n=1 Tax=Thermogemmatispora tikiterensis TaxID=1825093 RepID=A0A328VK52_9CHLR|nr:hypothetical protein A4R35_03700 [Thermogemmatispora tikiterensis]